MRRGGWRRERARDIGSSKARCRRSGSSTKVQRLFARPCLAAGARDPGGAIDEEITSEEIRRLPRYVGSIDQLTNVVCVGEWPERRARLVAMYAADEAG